MDLHPTDLAKRFLSKSWEGITERERRVLQAIAERARVSRPIHREMEERITLGERLADRVAAFGGSWTFIILFFGVLAAWMVLNSVLLSGAAFDRFPYILLNLLLSCLAAVQAPLILMSQNRQASKDREQAAHDYEVNLKAEIEILALHEKLDALRGEEMGRLVTLVEEQRRLIEKLTAARGA